MSLGLAAFRTLCEAGNTLEALRDGTFPGGNAWCALTELMCGVDMLIDALVDSHGLEEGDDDALE